MSDDRSQRVVYKLSFNLTQIFQHLLGWFLIPPSNNKGRRVNNRRNNNQEYLERHVQLIKQNRGSEGCRFNRPSSDVGRSKQSAPTPDLIFSMRGRFRKFPFRTIALDIPRDSREEKGCGRLKLEGREEKKKGGKKKIPSSPVDLVGIPWSPCANPGNRSFSWWPRNWEEGHTREKYEI